tara:strand:+ start:98 stop:565 length:468 start_codon:yes stop_codon:yes gene_type:complete
MYLCRICKKEKEQSEYNWKNKKQGIHKNFCRDCDKLIKKKFYQNHTQQVKDEVRERKQQKRAVYKQWKETLVCRVCGESDASCLDLHHKDPAKKDRQISLAAYTCSIKRINEETNKCVCVCSNCHRKYHNNTLGVELDTYAGEVFMDTHEPSKLE